jgi:hypothetical protein
MAVKGISHGFKSSSVSVKSGSIDVIAHGDDCFGVCGIIRERNSRYGINLWAHMKDRASGDRAEKRLRPLVRMIKVRQRWPVGSLETNPMENLLEMRVEQENPSTRGGYTDGTMAQPEKLDMSVVNSLVASIPWKMQKHCERLGMGLTVKRPNLVRWL